MSPPSDHARRSSIQPFAVAAVAILVACPAVALAADGPEAYPPAAARIEIEGGGSPFEPGARLKGRAVTPAEGGYRVEWRDANGTLDTLGSLDLDGRDVSGRGFAFDLSYPRARANELVLLRVEGRTATEIFRAAFEIALPPARPGLMRILVPDGGADAPEFPAEAVLWNVAEREVPPRTQGRELVLDLALGDLGDGPDPGIWGRKAIGRGTPSREARVRVPCLRDPEFRTAVREYIRKRLASPAAKRAAAVSLGTGLSSTLRGAPYDFCTSPHCEAAFREWLRAKYRHESALALAWGTGLRSWADAAPKSLVELGFPHATRYAAWADHLAFRDATFAEFIEAAATEVRTALPGAPVGFLGLGVPAAYGGADFESLGRIVDWRGPMRGSGARRLAETFACRGGTLAFAPGARAAEPASVVAAALSGTRMFFLRPGDAKAARALGDLGPGLARVIERSSPTPPRPRGSALADAATPRVALVWSQSSVRASFIEDARALGLPWTPGPRAPATTLVPPDTFSGGREGAWSLAWEAWCSLLADLGVTFECVSERDVARGDLVAGGYRAAVLVRPMSVPADAAREVERFARSGGVVVADSGAGLYDGMLARARGGALSKLFGVEHANPKFSEIGPKRAAIAERALRYVERHVDRPEGPSWFPHSGALGVGPAQSGLRLTTARAEGAFGDVPCLAVNALGGGWGVTLNLALTPYPRLRLTSEGGAALRSLVRGVLARAGIAPAVEVRAPPEALPPPAAWVRESGCARLVVVRRDARGRRGPISMKTHLTVKMDAPPAVHDPARGVFVGWTRDVEVDLAPGETRLFTLLPYRLRAIIAEPVGRPVDAGREGPELFEVRLRRDGAGEWALHVLEVRVEGPDGRARGEFARVIDVTGGKAEFVVPFAASDRPGLWTLRLRDAATGVSGLRRFVRRGGR
jgi:hypothetical protein